MLAKYTHADRICLLALLLLAQLIVVGVHSIKTNLVTTILCALSLLATLLAHFHFAAYKEPRLVLLPLEARTHYLTSP